MLLPVYARPPIVIDRGEGCYVWDTRGRRYLDFITGIGVNALGHAHPRITRCINEQAARCLHTSNLYHHAYQEPLARRLAEWSGLPQVFLSNSGSEAMEAALKIARAYSPKRKLIALERGFHGRTLGALSLTASVKYRQPFAPLPGDVTFVPANDVPALRTAFDDATLAVVLEPVQGEGGIHVLEESYLREVQQLCRYHNALWIADETQCGLGRTGTRFAFQRFANLQPDIVTTAKPLAAGLPLGATMAAERVNVLTAGQHGSTFGGGPLACRVALQVLELIDERLPEIRRVGEYFHGRVPGSRGAGLMLGVDADPEITEAALHRGLLINTAHETVLRMLPPYIVETGHVDEAMEILRECGGPVN